MRRSLKLSWTLNLMHLCHSRAFATAFASQARVACPIPCSANAGTADIGVWPRYAVPVLHRLGLVAGVLPRHNNLFEGLPMPISRLPRSVDPANDMRPVCRT